MIIEVRRAEILAAARQRGGVGLRELSRRFHVSIATIRRDLSALAERGLLRRVHGGAVPLTPVVAAVPREPAGDSVAAAAALVEPGMAIGVSGRRRAADLAAQVGEVPGLTLVTPMLAVARAVRGDRVTVVLIGGVRTPSGSHAGPLAEQALLGLHLDIAFVEPGSPGDMLAAATDEAMLRRAARRVFL
ncbi:DeoR family transcriptional regulator [Dactylosporangium sp. CA-139066]|uniref:DeoR family transcriptional regulator n=1 Tax=Dactylosporangium sp. CA-139066 TaxID=3239930 RepID=UPI003D8B323E